MGKTCILVRFKDGAFLGGNFIATVGIDFRVRETLDSHRMTYYIVNYFCVSHEWFVILCYLLVTIMRRYFASEKQT